jgi:hypothetical protein
MNTPKTEIESPPILPNQVIEEMERILRSKYFSQARSLESFLRYAVTKTLAHETDELKELLIGREVFQRDENYDPAKDAVVRVQAGILRKKLAKYYAEAGQTDEILIDLPKGGYVPTFSLRLPKLSPPSDDSISERSQPIRKVQRRNLWPILASFLIGLLVMLALQQWNTWIASSADQAEGDQAKIAPALLPIWGKFLASEATTILAYGTPQFFVSDGVYLRDVKVNSPEEVQLLTSRIASLQKNFTPPLIPTEVYTGVGEANGIYTLSRFFWEHSQNLEVSRNRLVGWEKVKNDNLIFLSSMRFHTLANELGYPNDFVIHSGVQGKIVNLRPKLKEQSEYQGSSFAVITLWPGKAAHRHILHLSGNDTWGTMAAAEYVTNKEQLRQLNAYLEQCRQEYKWDKHPAYFQVLVRAEVKDNQPISLTYLTHHDFALPEQTNTQTASIR